MRKQWEYRPDNWTIPQHLTPRPVLAEYEKTMKKGTIILAGAAMFIAAPASAITTTVESSNELINWYKMIFGFILLGFTAWSGLRIMLIPAIKNGNQLGIKILVSAFCGMTLFAIYQLFVIDSPFNLATPVYYRFGEEGTRLIAKNVLTAFVAINLAWNMYGAVKPGAYYLDDDRTAKSAALMSATFLAAIYSLFWVA